MQGVFLLLVSRGRLVASVTHGNHFVCFLVLMDMCTVLFEFFFFLCIITQEPPVTPDSPLGERHLDVVAGQQRLRGELKQQAVSVGVPVGRTPPLLLLLPVLLRQQELPARLLLALCDEVKRGGESERERAREREGLVTCIHKKRRRFSGME